MDGQLPFIAQQARYLRRKLKSIQLSSIHRNSFEKIQKEKEEKSLNRFFIKFVTYVTIKKMFFPA